MSLIPTDDVADIFFTGARKKMKAIGKKISSLASDGARILDALMREEDYYYHVADGAIDAAADEVKKDADFPVSCNDGDVKEMIISKDSSEETHNAIKDEMQCANMMKDNAIYQEEVEEMNDEAKTEGDEDCESDFESMGFELLG